MTPLAQTALDFCRDCLGWEDACILEKWPCNVFRDHDRNRVILDVNLNADDLNEVVPAASRWCHRSGVTFSLDCKEDVGYSVTIWGDWDPVVDSNRHSNPCHALLAACVDASRKLRAA